MAMTDRARGTIAGYLADFIITEDPPTIANGLRSSVRKCEIRPFPRRMGRSATDFHYATAASRY
jgi:hypothetical protein